MILLEESYVARTVNSFIDRLAHNGMCQPTFTSSWDGPKKQGGDDVDNVIADAMVKGVKGFDPLRAYELIKYHAFSERSGDYLRLGWQPETGAIMSCSYEMEYAYNDFCAAEVAAMVGDAEHAELLRKRSRNWDRIFNRSWKAGDSRASSLRDEKTANGSTSTLPNTMAPGWSISTRGIPGFIRFSFRMISNV